MLTSPFETELYEKLSTFFSGYGFELLAERKQFRRVTVSGFQNVILSSTDYEQEVWLEVNFGLRHEQIEWAAQQFLGNLEEFRTDANTLVVSIGKFNDAKYFRYKILNPDDLDDTCDQIKNFMEEDGFRFQQQYSHLDTLHHLFNDEPTKPCKYVYNQVHRCYKGLTAARLTNSPHFLGLSDVYRNQLVRLGANLQELHNFERLLSYLLYHSVN
jgi:hypothetical protein